MRTLLRVGFAQFTGANGPAFFADEPGGVTCSHGRPRLVDEMIRSDALDQWRAAIAGVGHTPTETRVLAELFQQLQERRFELPGRTSSPRLIVDRTNRRAAGSYFTPAPLIDYMVRETVGNAWREHWEACAGAMNIADLTAPRSRDTLAVLATFRVVDPACGGGDFLLGTLEFLQAEIAAMLGGAGERRIRADLVEHLAACGIATQAASKLETRTLLRWFIAHHCLFGVDLEPLAAELARARIWLAIAAPTLKASWLAEHIRQGNALVEEACAGLEKTAMLDWRAAFGEVFASPQSTGARGFQAVIGNPPYGAVRDARLRKALVRRWPQMRHNSDSVVGFVSLAEELAAPQGYLGLVVPKPLTYSFAWRRLRERLYGRLEYCLDVSRAWPEVLLEQVLLGWRPLDQPAGTFRGGEYTGGKFCHVHRASRRDSRRAGAILCSLRPAERRLLAHLERSELSLGDLCRTFRGLPLQRQLQEKGRVPVLGGRDLARWRTRSVSGYLPEQAAFDDIPFGQEKLLFQNIIAHVMRPRPHIRLIGAFDGAGQVTLDTVNNLVAREEGLDLRAVLALLHSRLVNWYVYAVVYNKAIRTMHFDQYFLNKIPLPARWNEVQPQLAEFPFDAARAVQAADERARMAVERRIERLVERAYGVRKALVDEAA
ncbi:MAG: hypothetical protein KF708_08145 [Pirellulales bacterium]|nr:hypothetical protein [Pirellulales bacterium]